MGLAIGIFTIGNDADGLAFDVVQLGVATLEVEGDVVHPTNRTFTQQAVVLGNGAQERGLGLIEIDRNSSV